MTVRIISANRMTKDTASIKGFTLIELIIVIVILGILAAVAIPKYMSMNKAAVAGVANGVAGALTGAASMLYAQDLMKGTSGVNDTLSNEIANVQTTSGVTITAMGTTGANVTVSGATCTLNRNTTTTPPTWSLYNNCGL